MQLLSDGSYELITVYVGKNSATYLVSEYMKHGDEATPIRVDIHPSEKGPVQKLKLEDSDGLRLHND